VRLGKDHQKEKFWANLFIRGMIRVLSGGVNEDSWKALYFWLKYCYNFCMLTAEEVKKIALLARIALSDGEVEKFRHDLSLVLDYVEELKLVDTEGLEIISQVTGLQNVQRHDEPVIADNIREIMANAPETKDGYYKVKAIL
jgi:aspartyl-tRNA(Asn)/glutamyl-tRNA(Gln) amidotransferase subunit C